RGFDLSEAPLWRVTLFRMSAAEYRMVWTYAHAILDSSFAEVVREVFASYEGFVGAGTPAPQLENRPPYRDHIVWLEEDLRRRADEIRAFWRQRLAGFTTPTNLESIQLPAARAASLPVGHDTVTFRVSRGTSDAVRRISGENGARPSTFVDA